MGWCSASNCTLSAKKVCVCFVFEETKTDILNGLLIVYWKFNKTEMSFLILLIKKFLNVT